ncbi:putative P450 monooxygenase [Teratosphaeria nubilosa]|uniref:Putative P450 monooxygenase n=1 Tax=Teratosphaeria nubilosa TaxID=161662 RepID=A0A6G1LPC5_9PEZI|nr:putative P450 monooxygenase [Teratosphaeria nubilosa]
MKEVPNDGLIRFYGFFNADRVLLASPKALGELLVSKTYDFEKPKPARDFLRKILGDGLIIVEGDVHKFQRKNIMPMFSFRSIKDLYPIFWDKSIQLVQGVAQQIAEHPEQRGESKSKTSVVEINHWANQVTMDIIGLAAMGRDIQALKNSDDPLVQKYEEILEPTVEKQIFFLISLLFPGDWLSYLPWAVVKRFNYLVPSLNQICLDFIRTKKEKVKSNPDNKDILSLLLRSNNFSDEQLVDQLLTFLAAGHETTSSAFTWSGFLLSKHPDIQVALREEVHKNVVSPNQPLSSDTDLASILESLPLLNGVCNEVLRLYPTVPTTVRWAVRDTSLVGHPIPSGTELILSPWSINRSTELWGPDAEEFVPKRWIDVDENTGEERPNNSGGAPSNYANLTFLHGPRSCIGQGFAKAELRALVATFVGSFDIAMADPNEVVVPHGVVTTKPKNGMHLRLRKLDGW